MHSPVIVALDGYTLNPGDLSWDAIAKLGRFTAYPRTAEAQVIERAASATIVITNKVGFPAATLAQLPQLKLIAVTATGYNIVDTAAAKARGVRVCNVPAYSTESVAQHTVALLLELTNHVGRHVESVRRGDWGRQAEFSYTVAPMVELKGKTIGLIGFGNIGRQVGAIAQALGMNVLVLDRGHEVAATYPIRRVDLDTLLATADVVSLHCPLTAENAKLINRQTLALMKPGALLLNTARGGLVDDAALAEALNAGHLGGAGLDVLTVEPPAQGNVLIGAKNCLVTPHIGWATLESRQRCLAVTTENIAAFIAGKPVNVVNR